MVSLRIESTSVWFELGKEGRINRDGVFSPDQCVVGAGKVDVRTQPKEEMIVFRGRQMILVDSHEGSRGRASKTAK